MNNGGRILVEYLDNRLRSPFGDWLRGLRDVRSRALIRKRLNRLRLDNFGDHRFVGEGVFELRIHVGPGYRVYFAEDAGRIVLLLCAGDKRSQTKDIERAKQYLKDYRS